jgi:hypothetical protein
MSINFNRENISGTFCTTLHDESFVRTLDNPHFSLLIASPIILEKDMTVIFTRFAVPELLVITPYNKFENP